MGYIVNDFASYGKCRKEKGKWKKESGRRGRKRVWSDNYVWTLTTEIMHGCEFKKTANASFSILLLSVPQ